MVRAASGSSILQSASVARFPDRRHPVPLAHRYPPTLEMERNWLMVGRKLLRSGGQRRDRTADAGLFRPRYGYLRFGPPALLRGVSCLAGWEAAFPIIAIAMRLI